MRKSCIYHSFPVAKPSDYVIIQSEKHHREESLNLIRDAYAFPDQQKKLLMQGKRGTKEMAEEFIGVPKEIIYQLLKNAGSHRKAQEEIFLAHLPEDYQKEYLQVIKGEKLPDLSSDVVAKKIFSPEEHPERLEYLLQQIAKDESIKISHEAMNEGYVQSLISKKMIFDLTAWLMDERVAGTEFQRIAQDFILERTEIYAADLLVMQYSTTKGHSKSEVNYKNTKGVLQVILMKNSPDVFDQPEVGDRYIHRFESQTADSGLIYANPLKETIFVQLDKCFAQFVEGKDGENNKELQILLSALYDVNHPAVKKCTKDNNTVNYSDLQKSELPASTTTALATMLRDMASYTMSTGV